MALITSFAVLTAVGAFSIIVSALGHRLLRLLAIEFPTDAEQLLCCAAMGVICFEVLIFPVQMLGHIRIGIATVLLLGILLSITDFKFVLRRIYRGLKRAFQGSRFERSLTFLATTILILEGFSAMAPVTGSDALHYHFAAPMLVLKTGFHPNFFLSHSFFTGQSHLLILAGLAFGSAQLAMGFLFLGGVLAAASAFCLARHWASRSWAVTVAILFLLTPLVFWQISSAGAPDLWMAFFATMGVLVISRSAELPVAGVAILAGALAGGIAGTKYTGCIVAASMALAHLWENRSVRGSALFVVSSLGTGVWPYARNFAWTGDPVFPFLMQRLSPEKVNAIVLAAYRADTGAGVHKSVGQLLKFPFFAGIDAAHIGFWEFFGPIVLAFAPLIILAIRNTPQWRVALMVWALSALGIGASSGMTRFLLPVFPVALAAAIGGGAQLVGTASRTVRFVVLATLGFFLAMGGAGLLIYEQPSLAAATGLTPQEDYLRRRAPEYEKVEFVNQVLAGKETQGNTLVFVRHGYYLRAPFVYGDPAKSWAVDASKYQTPEEWLTLFHRQNIHWVVRGAEYPPTIAAPLSQLESQGKLVPIGQKQVSDFEGMRISGERGLSSITILQVAD